MKRFLNQFGPPQYRSVEADEKAVGSPVLKTVGSAGNAGLKQAVLNDDPQAQASVLAPRRKAGEIYQATLDRVRLDGYVYPATYMPPPCPAASIPAGLPFNLSKSPVDRGATAYAYQ